MATREDIQSKVFLINLYAMYNFQFTEDDFLLRTAHSYNYQVSLLNGPMAKENSITYIWNYLQ